MQFRLNVRQSNVTCAPHWDTEIICRPELQNVDSWSTVLHQYTTVILTMIFQVSVGLLVPSQTSF